MEGTHPTYIQYKALQRIFVLFAMGANCSSNRIFQAPDEIINDNLQGNVDNLPYNDVSQNRIDPIYQDNIYATFDEFLETNCVTEKNKHGHLQEHEAAFVFFLRAKGCRSTLPNTVAHEFVLLMCLTRGFQTSLGYVKIIEN